MEFFQMDLTYSTSSLLFCNKIILSFLYNFVQK
nr:MAG TPA: hypothetical protein [Caudoviricetes sp.]